jgi:putative flippase GtrA
MKGSKEKAVNRLNKTSLKNRKEIIKEELEKSFCKIIKSRIGYFFIGGLIVFLIEWLLTIFLKEVLLIDLKISYFISLSIGLFILYHFHKKITFQIDTPSTLGNYEKFISVYSLSYVANWAIVSALSLTYNYLFVIPLTNISLGIINYLLNRFWVFSLSKEIIR